VESVYIFNLEIWLTSLLSLICIIDPLFMKVLEFLMNHAQLLVGETKRLPVCKAFNGSHLIQKYQIVVLQVEIYRSQVLSENLIVN